jgi:hypothetical protein
VSTSLKAISSAGPARSIFNLNSEVEQVVLLLVLVLENSSSLAVTLIERNSAGIFGSCFDGESQPIEHEHESLTSESSFNQSWGVIVS